MKMISESCLERAKRKKALMYSRLKATQIIGQRKAFCWQRISEFNSTRKVTVDKDLVITYKSGDEKSCSQLE